MEIDSFTGEYRFLSNFWTGNPFPYGTIRDANGDESPLIWLTAEHLFQAMKSTSPAARFTIHRCSTPAAAKRRGRQLQVRSDWETFRIDAMKATLYAKFRDQEMRAKLLATGDTTLIEGNTWGDTFWGQCPVGNGENMLGQLLMSLREELRQGVEDNAKD